MKLEKSRRNAGVAFGLIAICVFVCMISFRSVQAENVGGKSASSGGIKIGVVDLNAVFEKYEKRKQFDALLKEEEKKYQKNISDKKKELGSLGEKIQLLDLGSEARRSNEESFERKNMELESYAKFAEKSLVKKYKFFFESLYKEVCKEIEEMGKREQYDLIIKKEEPELQSGGISELQFKVGIKAVLYHSDAIDITNRVIANLNKTIQK